MEVVVSAHVAVTMQEEQCSVAVSTFEWTKVSQNINPVILCGEASGITQIRSLRQVCTAAGVRDGLALHRIEFSHGFPI